MNNTYGILVSIIAVAIYAGNTASAASLTCSTIAGSGVPVQSSLVARDQTPEWPIVTYHKPTKIILHHENDSTSSDVPVSEWGPVSGTFQVTYYDPSNGRTFEIQDNGITRTDTYYSPTPVLMDGDPDKPYPQIKITGPISVSNNVRGGTIELVWHTHYGYSISPRPNLTGTHMTNYSTSWPYDPVIDMGNQNPIGRPVSHTFAQNPTPGTSKLTLSINMEQGQAGSNAFRVNGKSGVAGTPLAVDGNASSTLLDVIPSGIEGPFKGTVTATLTCI